MGRVLPQLTYEEKRAYLEEHFAYEVREILYCVWFFVSAKQHKVGVQPDLEQFLENSSLDHSLLHARNLLEFYYETDKPQLYAHASAFVTGWRFPKRTRAINRLRDRVYPEVTHLGWSRLKVSSASKGWAWAEVAKDLLLTTERFLDSLDQKYRSPKLDNLRAESARFRNDLQTKGGTMFPDMFKVLEAGGHQW